MIGMAQLVGLNIVFFFNATLMDVSAVVLPFLSNVSIPLYSRYLYPDLVVQAQVTPSTYSKRARSPPYRRPIAARQLFTTQRGVLSYNTDLQQTSMSYYIVYMCRICAYYHITTVAMRMNSSNGTRVDNVRS